MFCIHLFVSLSSMQRLWKTNLSPKCWRRHQLQRRMNYRLTLQSCKPGSRVYQKPSLELTKDHPCLLLH